MQQAAVNSPLLHIPFQDRTQLRNKKNILRINPNVRLSGVKTRTHHCIVSTAVPPRLTFSQQSDTWHTWSVLLASAAFGLWSEKTRWGSTLSGALVATLVGLVGSNVGIIPTKSHVYTVVNTYLLPLAVPLLLFSADLKHILTSTGKLLFAFCIGSVSTVIGTIVAMKLVPLTSLGSDGWKIAAALMSRHIGGAVNYVAVSEALGTNPSLVASGLAADNLICALYFTTLFALASSIPAEDQINTDVNGLTEEKKGSIKVLDASVSLAISAAMCTAGVVLADMLKIQGGSIALITAVVVVAATLFPALLGRLVHTAESMALILMQVFFASVGASGSVWEVMSTAPSLFIFCVVQIGVHLIITLIMGKLLNLEKREMLLASNANVGGPTTAAGMATAKGWRSLVVPGILAGIFGISIATFLSIALGYTLLQKL